MNNKKLPGFVLVLCVTAIALLFGMSFVFSSICLRQLQPAELLAVRWIIPPIIIGLCALFRLIKIDYRGKPLRPLLLLVLFEPVLYSICETWGIKLTTASESSIFVAAIPLAVVVLEAVILKKKPGRLAAAGVAVGFLGVVCCIALAPGSATSGKALGYVLLILTMLAGAGYNLIGSNVSRFYSPWEMTFAMSIGGAVFFNIQNLVSGNGLHAYAVLLGGGTVTFAVLFLGAGCGFLAYLLYNTALAALPAAVAACVITNAINVVGVVSGIVITGDPWGGYTVVGVLLTIVGIVLAALAGKAPSAAADGAK